MMKKLVAVVVAALMLTTGLVTLSSSTALAGEITGNGKSLQPLNANSECAFSGLDDDDDDGFDRTQNWGQIPKEFRDELAAVGVRPSTLCNGHLNPQK